MSKIRLSEIDHFEIAVVDSPLEEVCRFYRGKYQARFFLLQRDPESPNKDDFDMGFMWKGKDAGIGKTFGSSDYEFCLQFGHVWGVDYSPDPDALVRKDFKGRPLISKSYPLYGYTRISRVASSPNLTYIEWFRDLKPLGGELDILSVFLKQQVITFRSTIRMTEGPSDCERYGDEPIYDEFFHEMNVHQMGLGTPQDSVRWTGGGGGQWTGGRYLLAYRDREALRVNYKFVNARTPLPFENPDHYKSRLIRDRFNRNIVCEYLENLGVDPERTLLEHDLLDPILFTHQKGGEPIDGYPEDIEPYRHAEDESRRLLGLL